MVKHEKGNVKEEKRGSNKKEKRKKNKGVLHL